MTNKDYPLTQYSHGAGCGCKISPKVLDTILKKQSLPINFPNLLVGNEEKDDAAVMDIGNGIGIVSTTDFFMPIVDDATDFGQIAAVNAISDIYAMGGMPIMAIAILGWPINQIPAEIANQVIEGGRKACADAGIPLAGGHSIDSPEPIFGLAVTGRIDLAHLKKNGGATEDCQLFLTKPLGVGILSTSQKKNKLRLEDKNLAKNSMIQLNKIGATFGQLPYIKAMTDVTGFGLLGHLTEMCEASQLSAKINFEKVPLLKKSAIDYYLNENCIPGGTNRNWDSYGHKIGQLTDYQRNIMCDPQTSGGLLVAVDPNFVDDFLAVCSSKGLELQAIGHLEKQGQNLIEVLQ